MAEILSPDVCFFEARFRGIAQTGVQSQVSILRVSHFSLYIITVQYIPNFTTSYFSLYTITEQYIPKHTAFCFLLYIITDGYITKFTASYFSLLSSISQTLLLHISRICYYYKPHVSFSEKEKLTKLPLAHAFKKLSPVTLCII